jgi:hypothetical protein
MRGIEWQGSSLVSFLSFSSFSNQQVTDGLAVEHILSVIENHRQANENVLRSLAIGEYRPDCIMWFEAMADFVDLTNEIRGERIRFVEAMQQATTVNVNCMSEPCDPVVP